MTVAFYLTPKGLFPTLQEAGDAHGITKEGARLKFKSPRWTEWRSHEPKSSGKKSTNIELIFNTEKATYMARLDRMMVKSPIGTFDIATTAKLYNVADTTIRNWIKRKTEFKVM